MKKSLNKLLAIATTSVAFSLLAANAFAADFSVGDLTLSAPWVRASVPGQVNGAGYLKIDSKGAQADRLLSATTEGVNRIELHTVITDNGVAKMREVTGVDVPAGAGVQLTPGGFHLMFLGLQAPFKTGAVVPVTLKFEKAGEVKVDFEIKPPTYNPSATSGHDSHRH